MLFNIMADYQYEQKVRGRNELERTFSRRYEIAAAVALARTTERSLAFVLHSHIPLKLTASCRATENETIRPKGNITGNVEIDKKGKYLRIYQETQIVRYSVPHCPLIGIKISISQANTLQNHETAPKLCLPFLDDIGIAIIR